MKHLYLMYVMALLINIGALSQKNKLYAHPYSDSDKSTLRATDRASFTVSGVVADETGSPFPGVNVILKGTVTGTTTDFNGRYSIEVPDGNSTLLFSFVGYVTQEIQVANRSVIDVTLTPDTKTLTEVVVTALGIEKDSKKLGYAATTVKTNEMLENRTTNMMESLVGKVAGLNITPPAAGAGASMQIRLRGQAAFAGANNAPLIVINGLPMDQGARGVNGAGAIEQRDRGDNLQNINPNDIESMTVLKGATAAALYGARAANGAIIITTKSGKKDAGIGVEYTSSYTASTPLNFYPEITQTEYGMGTGGMRPQTQGDAQSFGQFGFGERLDGQPTMNFDGVMRPYSAHPYQLFDYLRNGSDFTNTVALTGGTGKGSFRVSFTNTDAKGMDPMNEYKRKIFNIGLNHDISQKLKFQVNVNYANEDNINPPAIGTQGEGAVNFFTRMGISTPIEAYRESATHPETGAEYRTNGFLGTINNPFYTMEHGQYFHDKRNRLLGTTTLRYEFTDWLYLQGRFNFDQSNNFLEHNQLNGARATTRIAGDGTYRGRFDLRKEITRDINADFLLGASKEFGKFSVDASFGGNAWHSRWQRLDMGASNFIAPNVYSIGNGTVRTQNYGFAESQINSLYGMAEFGYDGLLYVNFTGRQDWFSVLNPANNHKFYPSVSGSFIFSELIPQQDWLSYGKLRSSWAQVGSANGVNPYEGMLRYHIPQNQFNGQTLAEVPGTFAPNAFLQPFTVTEQEIGLEMRLFKNKVLLDVAAFNKVTTDQIIPVELSTASGFSNSIQNLASLRNTGLEFMLEVAPVETKDFRWTTSWNTTYLTTEVLDLGPGNDSYTLINYNDTGNEFLGSLRYTVGLPMNQLYARTYLRNENGEIVVNDNGRLLRDEEWYPVGSAIPKHTGGWTNTFTYKKLSLGVFIDYKLGGTVLSSTHLNMLRQGHSIASLEGRREGENGLIFPGVYANGEPNTTVVTNLQAFYADYRNHQIGDPFTFRSDFVKLRNISLSYNLTNVINKVPTLNFVKGLMLTASCRNVAILYKDLPGLDPEAMQSSGDTRAGYENSSMPTARSYNFSLNVKF